MDFILPLLNIIELLLFIYLAFAAIYIFTFAFAGKFRNQKAFPKSKDKKKFAVLIPGYKEDTVIIDVAKDALTQNYPDNKYEIIIIADSFQSKTLEILRELPVNLLEVSFEKSTKAKALNKAMAAIGNNYDIALILDADNIMERNFLQKVNNAFSHDFVAIQAHRTAKNTNTSLAILDAISEEINNSIFRKGHRALGLSSALIGSGMAFDYKYFKSIMANINAVGGFDKELELKLLENRKRIEYLDNAFVKDEKIQESSAFAKQRKRWLSAQFIYFEQFYKKAIQQLIKKGNIDFADKVYQMVQPPRVILLGMVFLISIIRFIFEYNDFVSLAGFTLSYREWVATLIVILLAFLLAVPAKFYNAKTFKALGGLPLSFVTMLLSMFKLKGANKTFIHTKHGDKK